MDKNKVKIELYKSKEIAKFSHYVHGNLYYKVKLEEGIYQFPIETVDKVMINENVYLDAIGATYDPGDPEYKYDLSIDLGTTSFYSEMKGSDLNRWISKAIDKNEFTKIG